jgi:hypothetical protein
MTIGRRNEKRLERNSHAGGRTTEAGKRVPVDFSTGITLIVS